MPKVSVILPSLNVAGYIRECLESVIRQSLADMEFLCIDAGSTDGTYEILQEYARKDSRIRLIRSDRKSYGYQINLGMDMAAGEYLGIVETDDCIEPDMYRILYETAAANDLDYAKAGFYTLVTPYEGERYLLEHSLCDFDRVISHAYFTDRDLSPDVYIWNGVYRLDFLRKFHIRMNESPGAAFQDCGFRYLTDMCLGRGMFLRNLLYQYRRDNAASSTYDPRFARFNLEECRYIRKKMEKNGLNDRARRAFMARETVMMAIAPYTTWREHSLPDGDILQALDGLRQIILEDRREGLLRQDEMRADHFLEMRLFTEKPQAYEDYVGIRANINNSVFGNFVREMAAKDQIVICCAGKMAKFALCLMRMNGLENIAAVCDNNSELWGSRYLGWEVYSPREAVKQYPGAHYLVANRACPDEIMRQLAGYGIKAENMSAYRVPADAFGCTNLFMKDM